MKFQKYHNLIKNNNITKSLYIALYNNLTFNFIIGQFTLISKLRAHLRNW